MHYRYCSFDKVREYTKTFVDVYQYRWESFSRDIAASFEPQEQQWRTIDAI